MNHNLTTLKTVTALLCGLTSAALAGEPPAAPAAVDSGSMFSDFNFCSWLSSKPGTLYKDAGNPWVSEVQIVGRYHWNAAYIDGEGTNGKEFSETYTDSRRFRLGAKISFLNYLTFKGAVNLVDDQRFNGKELEYGYQDFDEAVFSLDAQRLFGVSQLDVLTFNYGRFKWHGGLEARTSSNELLTVERSAITNKLYQSARPTGFTINAVKGKLNGLVGIYSSDDNVPDGISRNVEGFGGWNDGLMYNAEVIYSATDDLRFGWEFLYNDADVRTEDSLLQYKWATTLSMEYAIGNGGINVEGFYGDNGDVTTGNVKKNAKRSGEFWAVTVTPYYWIVPAKLQAVVQLMYAGSEEPEGIRTNSRYFRATSYGSGGSPNIVNSGYGDELTTVYAGLNYLICGDNLKVQAGVEYTALNTPSKKGASNPDAVTYLFGFRSFF